MIRVTLACIECRQVLDGTFAADKLESMVTAFDAAHLYPTCREEKPDGGEAQDQPVAGAADEAGPPADVERRDRIGTEPHH